MRANSSIRLINTCRNKNVHLINHDKTKLYIRQHQIHRLGPKILVCLALRLVTNYTKNCHASKCTVRNRSFIVCVYRIYLFIKLFTYVRFFLNPISLFYPKLSQKHFTLRSQNINYGTIN